MLFVPTRTIGPFHHLFFYHFTIHFTDGGRLWKLFVVVDDSTAAYGVLRIVFADCK